MKTTRSARTLVFLALRTAIESEEALIDAYNGCNDDESNKAKASSVELIEQYKAYAKSRGMKL